MMLMVCLVDTFLLYLCPCSSQKKTPKNLFFCRAAEPMDSVCDGAGPREPSKVCQAEVECVLSADTQNKAAENPAITEPQYEVVDAAPASLESSRKDAESVPDGRTKAKVPKPGKA